MVYDKLLNTKLFENEENLQETFTIKIGPKVKKPSHNFPIPIFSRKSSKHDVTSLGYGRIKTCPLLQTP